MKDGGIETKAGWYYLEKHHSRIISLILTPVIVLSTIVVRSHWEGKPETSLQE